MYIAEQLSYFAIVTTQYKIVFPNDLNDNKKNA